MTMLMKENPNTFEMSYIFSEDVQAGELRSDLHDAAYAASSTRADARKDKRQSLAEAAWERFLIRQARRADSDRLGAAMREMKIA
jgi:hypothetical protein